MKFLIQTTGVNIDNGLRDYVERRGQFALTRLSDRISRVEVHLSDINGPRGGLDKHAKVCVRLNGAPDAIVEDTDGDIRLLVDRALSRAGRLVAKRIERGNQVARERFAAVELTA